MRYEIKGTPFPVVECILDRNETMRSEGGAMVYMDDSLEMKTDGGGIGKIFSKAFSGENLFYNYYTALKDGSMIAFGSSFPGNIRAVEVSPSQSYIVQKSAFLASTTGVDVSIFFRKKLGVGFFGGEGFIMQKIAGNGTAFLELDGSIIEKELLPGQRIVIYTGYLAMMESTCTMDIVSVKGAKNILLGGEGLFNTVVTGPGKVWIQTMPLSSLVGVISSCLPKGD